MKFLKLAILISALTVSGARADAPSESAAWKTQDVKFQYSGFTTRYSCSGLRDKLRLVLLALGARKDDLKIGYSLCGPDTGKPFEILSLNISLSILQPATEGADKPSSAHWQRVDIGRAVHYERGDCELAEQVRQSLLPLFATRNVEARDGGCAPRDAPSAAPILKLDVLLPDSK